MHVVLSFGKRTGPDLILYLEFACNWLYVNQQGFDLYLPGILNNFYVRTC